MRYRLMFIMVMAAFTVFGLTAAAEETDTARYTFYTVPGEPTGHLAVADRIANEVPDRLQNARLSVICRPAGLQADELSAALENALQKRFPGIRILDRKNLDAVLAEQGRQLEDYVNAQSAPELQRIELAQAILIVDIESTRLFAELSSVRVTAAVVDVETAVKAWQSAPEKYMAVWLGYPVIALLVILAIGYPVYLAVRRARHLDRVEKLEKFNYTQLRPRLKAVQERLGTLSRDLSKRKYADEAREIHQLNTDFNHLTDRAEILDTSISRSAGPSASKAVKDSLDKTAKRIESIEKLIAGLNEKLRENSIRGFDDVLKKMCSETDDILSDVTHLEQMKQGE